MAPLPGADLTKSDSGQIDDQQNAMSLPGWALYPLVSQIFNESIKLGGEARIVGGAVRDWLAGLPVGDIDMAVSLPMDKVVAHFSALDFKVVKTGIKFGTITLVDDVMSIQLTQTRVDLETDGRHAVVAHNANWLADAMRRDFTVNAIYLDADGVLHDPLGGLADLRAKRLRFAGDAHLRVREDALRILRFCRFLPRFISGGIDPDAVDALSENAALCRNLSGERVANEMRRILVGPELTFVIELINETAIDQHALGVTLDAARLSFLASSDLRASVEFVWIAVLAVLAPAGSGAHLSSRLCLGRAEKAALLAYDSGLEANELAQLNGPKWKQAAYFLGRYAAGKYAVQLIREGTSPAPERLLAIADWQRPQFPLRGADLLSHGVDNGSAVGQLLGEAERRWVASDFTIGKSALLDWLIGG
jgi:poly(A) polymerase